MMNHKIFSKMTAGVLLGSVLMYTSPIFAYTKEETVYTKLNTNGANYKTIVSNHIINDARAKTIEDLSDLLDIKNVNGDETFSQDGNHLIWNANGNDIYYQGESKKELPIQCKVTYTLDGKEISSKDLAGKSGKVTITIQYINKDKHTVTINGASEDLYTPFVVVTGLIADNAHLKNIQVTNGKIIDNGNKTVVMAISLPGLQESLAISDSTLEIPDTTTITMEATDFELGNIVSYVTPKVIEKEDLSIFDHLDAMYEQVNVLQSSSKALESGSKELKKGSSELLDGSKELEQGVSSAYAGARQIKAEVEKATSVLQSDTSDALDHNTLNAIKKQAAQSATLTDSQKEQIASQAKQGAILSDSQKAQIAKQAENSAILSQEQKDMIQKQAIKSAALSDAQKVQITKQAEQGSILSSTEKEVIISNAEQAAGSLTDTEKAIILQTSQSVATKSAVETALQTAQTVATQTAVQTALETAQTIATQTAVQTALETAQTIATQTALETALQTASQTAKQVAEQTSVATAKQVGNQAKQTFTNQVVSQMNTLGNGLSTLTNGLSTLNDGASKLSNGTSTLDDGISTLANGMKQFNEEGIEKICNYINRDVKDVTARIHKLQELSDSYQHFTMLNGENSGEVKFIMLIDSIKKEEDNKQEIILNDKTNENEEN